MSDFSSGAFLHAVPVSVVAVAAVLGLTFVASRIARKHSVIDAAWGLLFAAIATCSYVYSDGHGDSWRRALLAALTIIWGLRLAQHIGRRTIGRPEDPRYEALLAKATGNKDLYALRMIYLLQGVLAFAISAPIQIGSFEGGSLGAVAWVGVGVWVVGICFEAVGDRQLENFRRDPANKGAIISTGLWRYTRHPNYFGDACVWWGIFLVAAERWPGVLTIVSPVAMTLLLTKGSGARILERHMSGRAGWAQYVARTSAFIPLPPRNAARE